MSRSPPSPLRSWLAGSHQDLNEEEAIPSFGTFGLLVLLCGLVSVGAFIRSLPPVLPPTAEKESLDPAQKRARALKAALKVKATGDYREAWKRLRVLHDSDWNDPVVNFELALYHFEVGHFEFAREYLALVEAKTPDLPQVRMLRARLALQKSSSLQKRAGQLKTSRFQALAALEDALAALRLAEERVPELPSLKAPEPLIRKLKTRLTLLERKIKIKQIGLWALGTAAEKNRARKSLEALLKLDLRPEEQTLVDRYQGVLKKEPTVWKASE